MIGRDFLVNNGKFFWTQCKKFRFKILPRYR